MICPHCSRDTEVIDSYRTNAAPIIPASPVPTLYKRATTYLTDSYPNVIQTLRGFGIIIPAATIALGVYFGIGYLMCRFGPNPMAVTLGNMAMLAIPGLLFAMVIVSVIAILIVWAHKVGEKQ